MVRLAFAILRANLRMRRVLGRFCTLRVSWGGCKALHPYDLATW
jgi:hypothetical protein